jgi:signal transduction histidine kinase
LVIVKRCVEFHAGTLRLQSAPGEGTTVTVRVPLFNGTSQASLLHGLPETPVPQIL